jgi:hypothetical protein
MLLQHSLHRVKSFSRRMGTVTGVRCPTATEPYTLNPARDGSTTFVV